MKHGIKSLLALAGCSAIVLGASALFAACGHTHDFSARSEVVREATCNEDGVKRSFCECGESKDDSIPKTNQHAYTARSEIITQATCGEDGTERHYCQCGAYEDTPIAATGEHDYEYSERDSKAATCTEDGKRVEICTVCGDKKEETLPQTDHNFAEEWVTVKPATPYGEGVEQRSCQNEGCTEAETRTLPKTEMKNLYDFKVSVVRSTGAVFLNSHGTKVVIKDVAGNVVETSSKMQNTFRVSEGEYTVTLESLPEGYSTGEEVYVVDKDHTDVTVDVNVVLFPASEITSKTKLGKGSILYDVELEIVESNAADDYKITISELLKTYKCIYISLFYKTCQYCIEETDTLLDIYNSQSPSGNTYGEDVAFLMVGRADENKTTIRQFKANPNTYLNAWAEARNLPWMMAYCPQLDRMMSTGSYPVSFFTDCEGIVIDFVPGSRPRLYYTTPLDRGIKSWQDRDNWQNGGSTAATATETATAVDPLVPVQAVSKEDDLPQKPEMEVIVPAQRVVSFDDRKRVS